MTPETTPEGSPEAAGVPRWAWTASAAPDQIPGLRAAPERTGGVRTAAGIRIDALSPAPAARAAEPSDRETTGGLSRHSNALMNAAGLVVALLPAVGTVAFLGGVIGVLSNESALEWGQTHVGAGYYHSPADLNEEQVCWGTDPHSQWLCQLRVEDYTASGIARFPASQGGTCPLETRYECAKWAGLEQWDQDVPLWRPWELHNGPAGMAFSAGCGGMLGLIVSGYLAGSAGQVVRRFRFVAKSVAGGAASGLVLMDLDRHTLGEILPFAGPWLAAAVAVGGLTAWSSPRLLRALRRRREARAAAGTLAENCWDCAVPVGSAHLEGCDWAVCLRTGEQRLQCDDSCGDCGEDVWTGQPSGAAECAEYGWWIVSKPGGAGGGGWVRCAPGTPDAVPDYFRLTSDASWDPDQRRWVANPAALTETTDGLTTGGAR